MVTLWLLFSAVSTAPIDFEEQIVDALKEEVYKKMLASVFMKRLSGVQQPKNFINQPPVLSRKITRDLDLIDRMMEDVGIDEGGWDVYHTGSLRVSTINPNFNIDNK